MTNPNPTVTIKGKNKSGRAFKQARRDLDGLKSGVKNFTIAAAALSAVTIGLIARTAEQTRGIRAFAGALGVSIENMSRWQFAAESVGIQGDKVGDIMKDVADKIGDAYRNNAGEAKEAITSLGLDLEKLAQLSADQQLLAIAGALDTVGTTAEKVQIAESIGNDLSLLLPLLEDDAAGLQEMAKRADELGVTLTEIEAENIEKADRAIMDLKASFESIAQTLTATLGPALGDFLDLMRDELPGIIRRGEDALLDFGAAVMAAWEALNPSEVTGPTNFGDALVENMALLRRMRAEIRQDAEDKKPIVVRSDGAAQQAADAVAKARADELDLLYAFEDAKHAIVVEATDKRSDFEKLSAQEKTEFVIDEAIQLTRGVATQNKAMFEINKVAGIANAIINTHTGVTKSLSQYPWPLAGVMAGLHLAAGLAQVSAIQGATFSGAGGGGGAIGGGGGPAGVPPSDFATAPNTNAAPGQQTSVVINIDGNLYANDDFRNVLVEALNRARDLDELGDVRVVSNG